jgi:hypothetical protein
VNSTGRLLEVLHQEAQLLEDRYPGYRKDAVAALSSIIKLQDEGSSQNARRERTLKLVEDLGTKVLIHRSESV